MANQTDKQTPIYDDKAAQNYLRMVGLPASRATLYRSRRDGDLRYHTGKGRFVRYSQADLDAYVKRVLVPNQPEEKNINAELIT